MIELLQKNGRACVGGVEVLRWKISLPICDGAIGRFYEEICARTAAYCEGALRERAEREFEASEDEKKRFSFPAFSYRLEGRVTYEDEEYLSVCLAAELRRRGERSSLAFFEDGHVFEKSLELLLPPSEVVSQLCKTRLSRKERKAARGVLLSEKNVLWHDGSGWQSKSYETP